MREYGVSLRDLDEHWTPGRTLLYLNRIAERYESQTKKSVNRGQKAKELSVDELKRSPWMKG